MVSNKCKTCLFCICVGVGVAGTSIEGKKFYECCRDKPRRTRINGCDNWKPKDNIIRLRPFTEEEKRK